MSLGTGEPPSSQVGAGPLSPGALSRRDPLPALACCLGSPHPRVPFPLLPLSSPFLCLPVSLSFRLSWFLGLSVFLSESPSLSAVSLYFRPFLASPAPPPDLSPASAPSWGPPPSTPAYIPASAPASPPLPGASCCSGGFPRCCGKLELESERSGAGGGWRGHPLTPLECGLGRPHEVGRRRSRARRLRRPETAGYICPVHGPNPERYPRASQRISPTPDAHAGPLTATRPRPTRLPVPHARCTRSAVHERGLSRLQHRDPHTQRPPQSQTYPNLHLWVPQPQSTV